MLRASIRAVGRPAVFFWSAIWLGASIHNASAQVWLGVGYDGVSQAYYLSSIDTSFITPDSVEYLRRTATAINEGQMSLRTRFGSRASWDQTTYLTSRYWHHRTALGAYFSRSRPLWGSVEYRLDLKKPHSGEEATATTDFVFHDLRGEAERRFGDFAVRLRGRGELAYYPSPDVFAYDYRRYQGELRMGRSTEPSVFQEFSLLVTRRDVPDSARVSYNEVGGILGLGWTMGWWRAAASVEVSGRTYDLPDAGLGFRTLRIRANWNDDGIVARWPGRIEIDAYDYTGEISLLADFARLDVRQRRAFPLEGGFTPYLEPGLEVVASAADEDYSEPRFVTGAEVFTMRGWWINGEIGAGYRDYRNSLVTGSSDFWHLGVNLFADMPLGRRLSLSVIYSQDWEWHDDPAENLSVLLFSVGLRYRL